MCLYRKHSNRQWMRESLSKDFWRHLFPSACTCSMRRSLNVTAIFDIVSQDVFRKISCIFYIEDVAAIVIVVAVVIAIVFVISSLPSKYRWCVPRVRHLPEKEDFIYGWVFKYVVDKCLLLLLVETTRWSGIWKLWQLPICYCCLSMLEFPFCNLVLVVRNACGQHQHRPRHIGL